MFAFDDFIILFTHSSTIQWILLPWACVSYSHNLSPSNEPIVSAYSLSPPFLAFFPYLLAIFHLRICFLAAAITNYAGVTFIFIGNGGFW